MVKLSDATASLSVTRMLFTSTSWAAGPGMSRARAFVGDAAISARTIAVNPECAQLRIGRPPSHGDGIRVGPTLAFLWNRLHRPARLSHKDANASTMPDDPPDATDRRICNVIGHSYLPQNEGQRPVVSPGACALIASACTDPLSSASSAVLTMR